MLVHLEGEAPAEPNSQARQEPRHPWFRSTTANRNLDEHRTHRYIENCPLRLFGLFQNIIIARRWHYDTPL